MLGQGKFGKVYLACSEKDYYNTGRTNKEETQLLACKVMSNMQQGLTKEEYLAHRETLMSEINILKQLNHKNTVKMIKHIET